MCVSEVIVLMHGHRLAREDAGPHTAGAGNVFGPVRAEVKTCVSQLFDKQIVPEKIDADAFCIRQQQNVVLSCHLPKQALQAGSRRAYHPIGLIAVYAKLCVRHYMGRITARWVHPIELDASTPGGIYVNVSTRRMTVQNLRDFLDMMTLNHEILPCRR